MKIYLKVFRTLRKNSLMLLSLGVFLLSGTLTFAGNVTPAEAVAIAERYVQVNKQVRRMAQTRTAKLSPYYIYTQACQFLACCLLSCAPSIRKPTALSIRKRLKAEGHTC